MSFIGPTSTPTGTLGSVPPVSFPGVASGIDYNSIILKYTAATQQQQVPIQKHLNALTTANTEILTLKGLLGKVQDAITPLAKLGTFQAFIGTPSTAGLVTVTQIPGQNAALGTTTITKQTAATATQIVNDPAANQVYTTAQYNTSTPTLANLGASVTPSNGTLPSGLPASSGTLTINGVTINYNVNVDSLKAIVDRITAAGAGVTAVYNAAGTVTVTATTAAGIAFGSAGDSGNLLQVLHLDSAQLLGSGVGQNATSTTAVVGINPAATLQGAGNAGYQTQVKSGTFTINGVQITVNAATQSLNNVMAAINASAAGVTATFNPVTDRIMLTNNVPGPQSIVLGSASDTSDFLVASGLSKVYGSFGTDPNLNPTTTVGTQAQLTYLNSAGAAVTVYSSTNDFTSVIPGMKLTLTSSTATPYTVTVASDPKSAETAINSFVTAYNNAINELNAATAAPVIATTRGSFGQQQAQQATSGGPLYNNFEITYLRNQLVKIVSNLIPTGSSSYNSLQSIGLKLDTSSVSSGTVDATPTTTPSAAKTDSKSTQGLTATSGRLMVLDTAKFEAALAANPNAVQQLFTNATVGLSSTMGAQLQIATGLPTYLASSLAGPLPSHSLLNAVMDSNNMTISTLQQQIDSINKQATDQANRLRLQFTNSEKQIARLQGLQAQIAAIGR